MKTFIVYMPRLAAELRRQGFKIIETIPNEKKLQYDAYVFEDSPELQAAFSLIVRRK